MGSLQEIEALLDELETLTADDLEDQHLDFKQWGARSRGDAIQTVIDSAVCMANGGGGTVVLGVADQVAGRSNAIVGVPPDVEIHRLQRAVYDSTDPKLTPVFKELRTAEGTGRLLVMEVHPGMRPYTDTKGRGSIRIGKDCQPLTGTVRRKISTETGESDFTGLQVNGEISSLTSPVALEELRAISRQEQAPNDLLSGSDDELLAGLDLVRAGQLTHAGLLLAGATDALRERIPTWGWTYLRMRPSGTNYTDRLDGREALPVALGRLTSRILAENPIKTVHRGLFHYEYRTYPEVALREVLMNAFAHADYRLGSPILVKQFDDRIEISNPGGFIGGITLKISCTTRPSAATLAWSTLSFDFGW